MMFNNTNNNNTNRKNVNTFIKTLYSDLSCLQLTYWNDSISIKINPLTSISADGMRQYDYDRRINTAIAFDKCIALAEKIEEVILPAIENVANGGRLEAPVSVGVTVNSKGSSLFIEYKEDVDSPAVFLTLYTIVDQDKKASKDGAYSYRFNKVSAIENYDPDNGTGKESVIEAEFLFLYEKIKNISDACGTAAHSVNNENAYKTTSGNTNNSNTGYTNSTYSAPQQQNAFMGNNYSAPVSSFSEEGLPFN